MSRNVIEIIIKANDQATKNLSGTVDGISKKFQSMGASMMKSGALMSASVAPLALGFTAAVKSAAQFEEAMANAGAVLGKSASEMGALNDEILRIGATSRAGPQAAAEAFYDIVSGVADASTHMAILEAAIRTAEAGSADLGATTGSLIAIMNAYGFAAEEAGHVSDVLTRTVGMGVLTMDELAAAMPQVTAMGKQMGVSFDELGSMMALITTKGFSASEASTQMSAAMTALIKPTDQMKKAFEELGVATGEELIKKYHGLQGAMVVLNDTQVMAEEGMGALFGRVEAMKGLLTMAGEGAVAFGYDFKEGIEGATEAAQKIQLESLNAQMDLLKSQAQALGIEIGRVLIPAISRIVMRVRPVVTAITSWVRENPKLIQGIAAVVAIVGGLGAALMAGGAIVSMFGVVLGALLSPIGLIVAAVAALALAFKMNFLGIGDFVRGAFEDIKAAFSEGGLAGVGQMVLDKIKAGFEAAKDWAVGIVEPLLSDIRTAFETGGLPAVGALILDKLAEGVVGAADWAYDNVVGPIIDALAGLLGKGTGPKLDMADFFTDTTIDPYKTTQLLVEPITSYHPEPLEPLLIPPPELPPSSQLKQLGLDLVVQLAEGIGDMGEWAYGHIVEPIVTRLGEVNWSDVTSKLSELIDKFPDWGATAWDTGSDWVTEKLIDPVVTKLSEVNWSGVGNTLLDLLEKFLGFYVTAYADVAEWVWGTFYEPIVNKLAEVNWSDVANKLGDLLEKFIGWAGTAWSTASAWVNENIIGPIKDYLKEIDWSGVTGKLSELLDALLSVAGRAAGGVGYKVYTKIIKPIADYLGGITVGDFIGANVNIGNVITTILEALIGGAFQFGVWVFNNIIVKIAEQLIKPEFWKTAVTVLAAAVGGIGAVILGALTITATVVVWAIEKLGEIAQALIDAVPSAASALWDVGKKVAEGIWEGIKANVGDWMTRIVNLILGVGGGKRPATALIPERDIHGYYTGRMVEGPLYHDFVGPYQKGTPYLIGKGAQPQLFVPHEKGTAYPAGSYSLGGGGGGRTVNITGPVHIHGVQNPAQLLDALEREAGRRNLRLTARA